MKRRRSQRGESVQAQARRRSSKIGGALWLLAALAVVTLMLYGWWTLGGSGSHRPDASDPLASLDARAAYMRGVEWARHGQYVTALPYLRRAVALRGDVWVGHLDLGSVLFNSSVETRSHRGLVAPVTRSSWERVLAAREGLEHLADAERLAPTPSERAKALELEARRLSNWGLVWDALTGARRAASEPGSRGAYDDLVRDFEIMRRAGRTPSTR